MATNALTDGANEGPAVLGAAEVGASEGAADTGTELGAGVSSTSSPKMGTWNSTGADVLTLATWDEEKACEMTGSADCAAAVCNWAVNWAGLPRDAETSCWTCWRESWPSAAACAASREYVALK